MVKKFASLLSADATNYGLIIRYLPLVDNIIIMSVYPGFGGQEFISSSLPKIKAARQIINKMGLEITISVDGAVNESNKADLIEEGADILIYGSSLFKD